MRVSAPVTLPKPSDNPAHKPEKAPLNDTQSRGRPSTIKADPHTRAQEQLFLGAGKNTEVKR